MAPLRASSCTSAGRRFDVAFLPVDPPAISRLYVRWPGGTKPEDGKGTDLVATHRDLVLFKLASVKKLDKYPYLLHTEDHFILKASFSDRAGPQLQLKRLPVCTKPLILPRYKEGEEGEKEIVMQRVFFPDTVGLVRSLGRNRKEEEFAVAQLAMVSQIPGSRMMEAEVCVLRSRVSAADGDDGTWEVHKIPIEHKEHEYLDLFHWSTEAAITLNKLMCWVSYYRGGILMYNVLEGSRKISYVQLPIMDRPSSSSQCQAFLEISRGVCVTRDPAKLGQSILRFIDVARTDDALFGPLKEGSGFTIRSYSLSFVHMKWIEDFTITSKELWANNSPRRLPRDIPMFPLVSMDEPNIVYFLLSKSSESKSVDVVTIDTSTKKVRSIVPYIVGEEGLSGPDGDMIREKSHLLRSFIPSKFLWYLKSGGASEISSQEDDGAGGIASSV